MQATAAKVWWVDFFLLAAIWGASFLFMRLAALELGALPMAALRVAVATLFLLPLLVAKGHWPALRQHWRPVFFVGLLNSAIPFALFGFAVVHISTGLSAILNATVPLFGALVAWVWLKDPPGLSRSVGLAIGFGGVVLLASGQASFQPNASGVAPVWAVLACLAATSCYALAASFTRKHLPTMPPLVAATGSQMGAMFALALPALWFRPDHMPSAPAWGALIALGVLCTGIAYVIYFRLIDRAGPSRALTVTFMIPVFAIVYGVLLLGEQVTSWMLLCGLVILAGTALSSGLLKLPGR